MKIHAMFLCLVEFPWTIPIEYTSTGSVFSMPPGSPRYIINVFTPLNFLGTIYNMVWALSMRRFWKIKPGRREIPKKNGGFECENMAKTMNG